MKVHDVVIFIMDQSPEPGFGSQIDIVAQNERPCFHSQRLALSIEPPVWMGQEINAMSTLRKVGQKTEDLSLATTPMPFWIDMENFKQAAMTACRHGRLSPPAPVPRA